MKTKPIQRLASVIALVALALSALVVPALAAPPASATLTQGASFFPGEDRVYEFTVTNDGGNTLTAEPIDWVRVILPTNVGVTLSEEVPGAPSGWDVEKVESRFLNAVIFRATSPLSEIRGSGSATFSFTADVARPSATARRGELKVDVSSDNGQSANSLPALPVDIEILEVVKAPTLATDNTKIDDGSATAGQTLAYDVELRNHAANAVTLATATLAPQTANVVSDASYSPSSSILTGAGADLTKDPQVTTLEYSGITTLSRTSNPDNATETRKNDASVQFKATFAEENRPASVEKKQVTTVSSAVTVQAPASLQVSELIPAFTRSTVIADDGTEKVFRTSVELLAKRLGTVSIDRYVFQESGTNVSTISFAATEGALDPSSPIADNTVRRLVFTDSAGNTAGDGDGKLKIEGDEGTYDATVAIKVTDANGATYLAELSKILELNPITIINGGPDSRLDVDINPDIAEGERDRLATRDGEPVEFTYYVFAPEGQTEQDFRDSLDLDTAQIQLLPNGLVSTDDSFQDTYAFEEEPTWETGVEYTTATGSTVQRNALKFVQTITPDWPGDIDTDSDIVTTSFKGFGSVEDLAGNTAGDDSISETVDNVRPQAPGYGFTGKDKEGNSVIQLSFTDAFSNDFFDGCDPSLYRIDNIPGRVADVRYGVDDETPCTAEGPNTPVRVLVLNYDLQRNETPDVDYLLRDPETAASFGMDPIIDGAFNPVNKSTIQTLVGIRPAAPSIIEVTRTNSSNPNEGNERELAFVDPEGATYTYDDNGDETATANTIPQYWTNTGGGLGDVNGTTGDLLVTFTGAQDGYNIVVEDESGNELRRKPVSGQSQLDPSDDGERTVLVPLPDAPSCTEVDTDGYCTYIRFLRFVPADNEKFAEELTGIPSVIEVALDVRAPSLESVTAPNLEDFVTVGFSEHILSAAADRASGSSDRAEDWYAWESPTAGSDERSYYGANEVAAPSSVFQRDIRFSFQDRSLFRGVEYFLTSAATKLAYEDRAGNHLVNQEVLN